MTARNEHEHDNLQLFISIYNRLYEYVWNFVFCIPHFIFSTKMIKLYGMAMSTCTRRVRCVLEEMGLKYELVVVNLMKGEHKQAEHLKRQPFGQIPALEDVDGTMVFESRAIIRYLVKKYPAEGAKVCPSDAKTYGQMEQWLEVEAENYNPLVSTIVFETMFKKVFSGAEPDMKVVEEKTKKLEAVAAVLDAHLAKHQYMAGSMFTMADISYLPYTDYLMKAGHAKTVMNHPHIAAWWKRCTERPSWQLCSSQN